MCSYNFTPDNPLLGSNALLFDQLFCLGSVDVSGPLAQVEFGILRFGASLNSKESRVAPLVTERSLVAEENCLSVEASAFRLLGA